MQLQQNDQPRASAVPAGQLYPKTQVALKTQVGKPGPMACRPVFVVQAQAPAVMPTRAELCDLHQSLVIRTNSCALVMPLSTKRWPSSRISTMPLACAAARMSASAAWAWI